MELEKAFPDEMGKLFILYMENIYMIIVQQVYVLHHFL